MCKTKKNGEWQILFLGLADYGNYWKQTCLLCSLSAVRCYVIFSSPGVLHLIRVLLRRISLMQAVQLFQLVPIVFLYFKINIHIFSGKFKKWNNFTIKIKSFVKKDVLTMLKNITKIPLLIICFRHGYGIYKCNVFSQKELGPGPGTSLTRATYFSIIQTIEFFTNNTKLPMLSMVWANLTCAI